MSKEVIIKSNKYGIILALDPELPFDQLLELTREKFRESGGFFKDAKMALGFEGRKLSLQEEQLIAEAVMENCALQIVSIMDSNKDLEELMQERVEAAQILNHTMSTLSSSQPPQNPELPQAGAGFYKGNLRSGQTLECETSVTLIGDVNPGAKIISGGNIVVLGSLKGNACAGAGAGENCFIFALDMRPIQLQIGDMIAKSPDPEKGTLKLRRKKAESTQYAPQIAVVRDGYICVEPMTKGCLDRL